MSDGDRPGPSADGEMPGSDEDEPVRAATKIVSAQDAEYSAQLMDLVATDQKLPDMFALQAKLLAKRRDALLHAGFTRKEALEIILRFGLKKDLV